jgi:ABC-type transport system involved in multi-copper enzyme maturation permease subunit
MVMPFWNKALLWKEWRQNRWIISVTFFLTGVVSIVLTLLIGALKALNPAFFRQANWSDLLARIFDFDPFFGMINALTALVLGTFLLSQERTARTLEFLVTTPVSRRDIVNTKYAIGASTIIIGVLFVFLFATGVKVFLPVEYGFSTVLKWFFVTGSVMLSIFSLSFFVSTLTGNILASAIGALVAIYIPLFVSIILEKILASFSIIPWGPNRFSQLANIVSNRLTLLYYLTGDTANISSVPLILLVGLAFYFLSCFVFERNHLERDGKVLLFGDFKYILKASGSFFVALILTAIVSEELKATAFVLIFVFVGVSVSCWGFFSLVSKLQRTLSNFKAKKGEDF